MSLMRRSLGVVTSLALVLTLSSSSSSQEFGSITFPTSGAAGGAGRVPDRREGAAQLPVRRSRGRVPGGAQGRSGLCDGLLGRGDEPQPSAVGAAGPREGQGGARPARRPRRPAGWPRRSCPRRRRSSRRSRRCTSRRATSWPATTPTRRRWPRMYEPVAGRQRGRDVLRAVAARHGAAGRHRLPPSGAGRLDRRVDLREEPEASRRRALHHPRLRRSRSRAARPECRATPTPRSRRRPRTRCTCRRTSSCSSGMWQDAVDSNIAAYKAAVDLNSQHEAGRGPRGLPHAVVAGLRQPMLGKLDEAKKNIEQAKAAADRNPTNAGIRDGYLGMRARFISDTGQWEKLDARRRPRRPPSAITPTCPGCPAWAAAAARPPGSTSSASAPRRWATSRRPRPRRPR